MEKRNYSEITPQIKKLAAVCESDGFITSDLYEKYKVNRGLRDLKGKGVLTGLTEISEIEAKKVVDGEEVALDVAPFIENNRTMMQFNVLYVFGIDVQWVAETQSIVAEGNGIKVVMQLGSKVATVNGEEVTLDVAPYSVNGRTVVPVGFITGLLDITPTFTYNADGTIADILFTK